MISNFILLQSEKILLLNLLRPVLWPDTWPILEGVPWARDSHEYTVVGWSVLRVSGLLGPRFPYLCLLVLGVIRIR